MKTETEDSNYTKISSSVLLDKVDRLFTSNAGDLINLPQLVVVGDQSSGKSSVLAGLTRLPFPRSSGLCTRFATKITFRRSLEESISVSISPGQKPSPEHAEKVRSWSYSIPKLTGSSFANILNEAHAVMGVSKQDEEGASTSATFSDDVLLLEICGPDEEHLSIIDVPGIFRTPTEGVTTEQDIRTVEDMVHRYMNNPRSVMLTVVPANLDIATQEIVQLAKKVDLKGDRTIGVLTKPDLVEPGTENNVLAILNGKIHSIKLGWNVVCNPSPRDVDESIMHGDVEDQLLRTKAPWTTAIEKGKVGTESLRLRLQDVLTGHIRREFPKVRTELSKRLRRSREELESLGEGRETREQQRSFLLDIVTKFQDTVSQALFSNRAGNSLFDNGQNTALATLLADREEKFSRMMLDWGQEYVFQSDDDARAEPTQKDICTTNVRTTKNPLDLDCLLLDLETIRESKSGILAWIEGLYRANRGFEMGTFAQSLLPMLMKRQSQKWRVVALGYISDAIAMVHEFILEALGSACSDEGARLGLMSSLMDDFVDRYNRALEHAEFLISVETSGFPRTQNSSYNEMLEDLGQKRTRRRLQDQATSGCKHGEVVKLHKVQDYSQLSNTDSTVGHLHDVLESYYEVSRNRFVDSTIMQAVHYHLLTGPKTPFQLISSSYVLNLSESQLEDIAGEDSNLIRKRDLLKKEIADLEGAQKILF